MSKYCIHADINEVKDKIKKDEEVTDIRAHYNGSHFFLTTKYGWDEIRKRFEPEIVGLIES